MKLFKDTDEKFMDLGFTKVKEDEFGASYEKLVTKYGYTHVIDILHKASGRHLIQSYQKGVNAEGFSHNVGMSISETRLALKKAKEMGYCKVRRSA